MITSTIHESNRAWDTTGFSCGLLKWLWICINEHASQREAIATIISQVSCDWDVASKYYKSVTPLNM